MRYFSRRSFIWIFKIFIKLPLKNFCRHPPRALKYKWKWLFQSSHWSKSTKSFRSLASFQTNLYPKCCLFKCFSVYADISRNLGSNIMIKTHSGSVDPKDHAYKIPKQLTISKLCTTCLLPTGEIHWSSLYSSLSN